MADKPAIVEPVKVPKDVLERCDRGRSRMRDDAAIRNECWEFFRGRQYVYRDKTGHLVELGVTRGSKPDHRVRQTRNLVVDVVRHEVSAASSRVPSYEVTPSTTDQEDIDAARTAERVALFGYEQWNIRKVTIDTVTHAVVADEGFAWPYFDNTVPPFISADGIGVGEIRIEVLGANEVFWEPGTRFEDSRWWCVERARPVSEVERTPGFLGGRLEADAQTSEVLGRHKTTTDTNLVLVSDYLERPCAKYPQGRRLTFANGRLIFPEEPYPLQTRDPETGNLVPVDEPVLHKLAYIRDPDNDRDMGLVRHLLDAQRTYNDATNKQIEWKNLALNPQVILVNTRLDQKLTDEPGAVYTAKQFGAAGSVNWRPVPPVPPELARMREDAAADIGRIASQNDIPSQVESGKGIQAIIERDAGARQSFIAELAAWHSRLMRHCLMLVQRYYTERRLAQVNGRFGPDPFYFKGSDLRGQVDVRVAPASIEPRTKQAINAQILAFADRGWITPQAAMAAINGGTAEKLIEGYELHIGRANRIIQQIKAGPDAFMNMPDRVAPDGSTVPGWMPRPFDNVAIHKSIFEDWMCTRDYESAPPEVQHAADLYYQGLLSIEAEQQARAIEAQNAQAEQAGLANAARPGPVKQMPDRPSPDEQQTLAA